MLEALTEFAGYLLHVVSTSRETQLTLCIFALFTGLALIYRRKYNQKWAVIYGALDKYVNSAFRLSSQQPLRLTAQCRRFAATNYGVRSQFRYFRLLTELPPFSNVFMQLYQHLLLRKPSSLIYIKIQPECDNLYAAIIAKRYVYKCQKAFVDDVAYFYSVKDFNLDAQRYEICQDLAAEVEISHADFVVLNDGLITVQCSFEYTADVIEKTVYMARRIAKYQPTIYQQQQIYKKIRNAQKQISSENARKQADENEESAAKKVEELEDLLRSTDLTPDKRAKIQAKIDYYIKKEQAKASRKVQQMMGLGGAKSGGGKRYVIK